jgi:hypothetical protein
MPNRTVLVQRLIAALVIAAAVTPWPLMPAGAEHQPGHEPIARLQIVLKEVYIFDDNDPGWFMGAGEMSMRFSIPHGWNTADNRQGYAGDTYSFSASGGNRVQFDRLLVPRRGGESPDEEAAALGFLVYPGAPYSVYFEMQENDDFTDVDYMGVYQKWFGEADDWGIGTHKVRSYHTNQQGNPDRAGDYEVTFEIRRAPLPDLDPVSMQITRQASTDPERICEVGAAGHFWVGLLVNGERWAGNEASGLAPGQHVDLCMVQRLPPSAELVAVVDEERAVLEYNETNNRLVQAYTAPATPTPTPGPTQPDLWARGLLVGSDGCKAGRNDVTVLVKNEGASTTSSFVVRLVIDDEDDDESHEKTVTALDAGKELEVKFEDVRARRGLREFEATVDARKTIAELNEDNNTFDITFNCRDD